MAFTATAIIEVRTTGDDTNHGGIFDRGVAGFPTDGAATSATGNSPVFSSASYTFVAGDAGAWIYIKAGSNWSPGFYKIASVNAGAATLNAAIGAGVDDYGVLTLVAGVASTASPSGATWGIDYSQSDAHQIAFTDMVIGTAGNEATFTSSANPVGKNFIGNSISITAGTNWTVQRVVIVSTSGTTATCDKALGTAEATGGTGELGGAIASPGLAAALHLAGNLIWIKNGTYTITTASTNTSGGCMAIIGTASSTNSTLVQGYTTVRGDYSTRPTLILNSGVSNATIISRTSGTWIRTSNVILDGASQTGSVGITGAQFTIYRISGNNCAAGGIGRDSSAVATAIRCSATGCGGGSANAALRAQYMYGCESYANTCHGIWVAGGDAAFCVSRSNTGTGVDGFIVSANAILSNCSSYGNTRNGFVIGSYWIENCIAEANGGVGFSGTAGWSKLFNCAAYNNTGGALSPTTGMETLNFKTITVGSVFTNAAGGDFSLNNTANCGALLRAAGYPGAFPNGTTTGYLDIGAVQHADPVPTGTLIGRSNLVG